ncbi:ATP-binding protein [Piscinibacter sp.]|uniref:ATP-binding protein n=1 Tax=Piscinibacter sp. TaxID=1903157 RepID=UPI002F41B942
MSASPGSNVSARWHRTWLVLIGVSLALALLGAGYVQWRQVELLDDAVHGPNDALGWSFFQLETEQLRLRNQLQQAIVEPGTANPEELKRRVDILARLVATLDDERAARILHADAPILAQVRAFVAQAERALGGDAGLDPAALRALLGELDALSTPLHELSLGASQVLSQQVMQRNDAARLQSKQSIALTLFQCVLLFVFAFAVLRQFRVLRQRRERLETLAARLGNARIEAESASRAKSVFLANMSHEIRTPFHGLLGMMSLLQETPLSAQQSAYLHTAKESANHLLAILNDILDISKLESGKLQVVPEPVDLARLVREVDALMRVQAHAKGLALQVTMDAGVPRWVHADATRVKQILFNLMSNAVKFTPAGEVTLQVEARANDIAFSVIDTGVGIDDAVRSRVFQRFAQGDETTSRRHGGTGLGLEISRSLARLMGGDIEVSSHPGVGSRFVVTLPLPAIEPPAPGALPAVAPSPGPARALKVLVAEDHPVNRIYLEAVLDKLGHRAVFAENGEEAVCAAQEEDFDIVLMDLHMPVMDGFAAARAIRALPLPRGAMPIVALTADAFQDAQEGARQAGMDEMLTKPAHLPQLRALLARYGGATAPQLAPTAPPPEHDGDIVDRATVEQFHASLSPQQYASLLESFFASHAGAMTRLRDTAAAGARREAGEQAHALKGAALSLGLRAVVEAAQALQQACGDAARPDLTPCLDALERHLLITRDLCQSLGWLPSSPAPDRTPN